MGIHAGLIQRVCGMSELRTKSFAIWSAFTIFVSAFLLFQVQPIISKMILPWFGGSPAVWSTCMLFFQMVLLAGYAYAHFLSRTFVPRTQIIIHGVLLLAALVTLPILPGNELRPLDGTQPTLRILTVLVLSVGLPYFLLSSTGPLVQSWFTRIYEGHSPYRLYALSNVGSLGALVSYPFYFEPRFALREQDSFWSWGFGLFALLNGLMAVYLWRLTTPAASPAVEDASEPNRIDLNKIEPTPDLITKLLWVFLPALASVALLAVTNHLSQDVAAVPFLWVLPLSLYLVSFILCFDSDFWYRRWFFAPATMLCILWFCLIAAIPTLDTLYDRAIAKRDVSTETAEQTRLIKSRSPSKLINYGVNGAVGGVNYIAQGCKNIMRRRDNPPHPFHLLPTFDITDLDHDPTYQGLFYLTFLFSGCMLCHGELVKLKPGHHALTEYFLMISAGGALGGVFVALICPRIFSWYAELPLSQAAIFLVAAVTLCMMISPLLGENRILRFSLAAVGLSMMGGLLGNGLVQSMDATSWLRWFVPTFLTFLGAGLGYAILASSQKQWQVMFSAMAGLFILSGLFGFVLTGAIRTREKRLITAERSFYGALQVKYDRSVDPEGKWLTHGRISHGFQFLDDSRRKTPCSYYAPNSGVGLAIRKHPRAGQLTVGVVGLGTGTIAAYGQRSELYRFYEIDELVIRLSDAHFTYRSESPAVTKVVLGDARIQMEREEPQNYDVIAVDAFSGDAIPVHLLTRECMDVYLKHLKPDGILAIHTSNRYLDLLPVVLGMAHHGKMQAGLVKYAPNAADKELNMSMSDWVLVTNNQEFLADDEVIEHINMEDPNADGTHRIEWTDQYSNLFEIFK